MSNEEKVTKYCKNKFRSSGYTTREEIMQAMLFIVRWKDEQHNEEKKELLGLVNMLPIDETNQTIIEDLKGLLK